MVNQKGAFGKSFFQRVRRDERGQAFSVFELMIAAIVAIAILAVLMSVLGGGLFNPTSNPVDSISAALSSASPTGQSNAQKFILDSRETIISSIDLANKSNLDRQSVVIFAGQLGDRVICESTDSTSGEKYTYCKYNRTTASSATAKIYCAITGNELIDKLNLALDSSSWDMEEGTITEICGEEEFPCCAVLLAR